MSDAANSPIDRLLAIMATLREPVSGCEWDREQTFETIAPYTIEEAYEVADAIDRKDFGALREELGDLLLQVVFHARMAEEHELFAFQDVAAAISAKLEKRHPHIFGDENPAAQAQSDRWEKVKADERSAKGETSAVGGIANALPALMRAEKLQKRAARVGFDWPDVSGPTEKLHEELAELESATNPEEQLLEAGDVLFAAANIVRQYGLAPEDALRASNAKFEKRFRLMEAMAQKDGKVFAALSLDQQEAYWLAAKASERGKAS